MPPMNGYDQVEDAIADRSSLAQLCYAMDAAYGTSPSAITDALKFLGNASAQKVAWGAGPLEYVWAVLVDSSLLIFWRGLQATNDWVEAFLGSDQVPCIQNPGKISSYSDAVVQPAFASIDGAIGAAAASLGTPTIDVVFLGHSQGGASSIAYLTQHPVPLPSAIGRRRLVTFASPRCLDPAAAGFLNVPHFQVSSSLDAVPQIPPVVWYHSYPPIPPVLPQVLTYVHHGNHYLVSPSGSVRQAPPESPQLDNGLFTIAGGFLNFFLDSQVHNAGNLADLIASGSGGIFPRSSGGSVEGPNNRLYRSSSMDIFKVVYFFEQGPAGWSERFFLQEANVQDALTKATDPALITSRMQMLAVTNAIGGFSPSLGEVRVSNIDHPRDSFVQTYNPPTNPVSAIYADFQNMAMLVSLPCVSSKFPYGTVYKGRVFVKGFDDQNIKNGGQLIPTAAFASAFQTWGTKLISLNFGCYLNSREIDPVDNDNIANNGADVEVTTHLAHGMLTGDEVEIQLVTPKKIINGVFTVKVIDATHYLVRNKNIAGQIDKFGTSRKFYKDFFPIFHVDLLRGTTRRSGRPFDVFRGRRSTN